MTSPVNTVPVAQTSTEDMALAFGAGLSVNDVDGNLATTRLTVSNGTLTVNLAGGVTISAGANGAATLTLSAHLKPDQRRAGDPHLSGHRDFNAARRYPDRDSPTTRGRPRPRSLNDIDTVTITSTPSMTRRPPRRRRLRRHRARSA